MDRLANTVRPYAWGSTTAIPELLGTEPTGEPQAELWMGAHPGAPSLADRGDGPVPLSELIAADPAGELGEAAAGRFGPRLPFLLKLLAAASPLSLQVHPDLAQAESGFADEERRGVPADAPHRNYKDANHKPELICALTPFDGLCGFRPAAESAELLSGLGVDSLKPYADILHAEPEEAALREVLTAVLTADRAEMAETVRLAAEAAERLGGTPGPHRDSYAAYASIARHYPGDPGVIAAMLLNFVTLQPGEALFLGAGVPHAYLDGLGVELMANSDNVLRCGLTPKHVDVPELLRVTRFEATAPAVLRPEAVDGEETYETPVDEFRLSRYALAAGAAPRQLPAGTPQILLCTAGTAVLTGADGAELPLSRGESAYVPAAEQVRIGGTGTVFRATVRA
ncbi:MULTISPECIES: mannose-6-phosphate isomerase, class I [Streptomyces]|uniref:mannose-6-phosphate isomerase n=1 Tax=Streptomyces lycii TaxID=2654337 RepID=A0ABQ7FFI3_9ACTN|nr:MULTISPECIES: mannose-6-phosphate isomerase, class I [Streptomyces]KAF4407410.1 mannose-6-phosphate isomerase, class I [Streptomyces lycii]PGH50077.1 mannose-6-phosphate isomerase, class I [Streptomyces sp. Ru87]